MSIIEKAADRLKKEVAIKAEKISDEVSESNGIKAAFSGENVVSEDGFSQNESQSVSSTTRHIDINLDRLSDLGIVTPKQGKTQLAEQFRIIKRPLLTKIFSKKVEKTKNANLIMIASSLSGEGKSFCAVNLAMSIASEMDHRVLLVDGDVARPSVPRILGIEPKDGLLDLLLDNKLDVADVMIKTNIEKLSLITAGNRHPHATELLASHGMSLLLDELAQRYDDRVVIFDSPPLLLTSEARVLAARMGQIVLVVEAERVTHQAVKETLRHLESFGTVNLIYNKSRSFAGGEYYGYYYS